LNHIKQQALVCSTCAREFCQRCPCACTDLLITSNAKTLYLVIPFDAIFRSSTK
jgi:hypothetical protein